MVISTETRILCKEIRYKRTQKSNSGGTRLWVQVNLKSLSCAAAWCVPCACRCECNGGWTSIECTHAQSISPSNISPMKSYQPLSADKGGFLSLCPHHTKTHGHYKDNSVIDDYNILICPLPVAPFWIFLPGKKGGFMKTKQVVRGQLMSHKEISCETAAVSI